MDIEPDFSFILVNYKSADVLPACFSSFSNISIPGSFEIIVANNDPSESKALQELQKRFSFTRIELSENVGFSGASNRAARVARGRILCFLNPDARFLSGDFSIIQRILDRRDTGIVGLRLLEDQSHPQKWSAGDEVTLLSLFRNHIPLLQKMPWKSEKVTPVSWVSGAAMLLSRQEFFRLGGFDEAFFLYYEDVDLSFRSRQSGKQVLFCPDVSVLHVGGNSMNHGGLLRQKEVYYRSQQQYFSKYRPRWEQKALSFFHKLLRRRFGSV